jgi:hypothetical protein
MSDLWHQRPKTPPSDHANPTRFVNMFRPLEKHDLHVHRSRHTAPPITFTCFFSLGRQLWNLGLPPSYLATLWRNSFANHASLQRGTGLVTHKLGPNYPGKNPFPPVHLGVGGKKEPGWVPVAHACNPSYSGGRDQDNCSLKSAWANSSQDPISKIPNTKQDWQSGSSGRVPTQQVFKPQNQRKKKMACICACSFLQYTDSVLLGKQLNTLKSCHSSPLCS